MQTGRGMCYATYYNLIYYKLYYAGETASACGSFRNRVQNATDVAGGYYTFRLSFHSFREPHGPIG